MTYQTVKQNYQRGLWNAVQVAFAVKAGVITPAQFAEITGQVYEG